MGTLNDAFGPTLTILMLSLLGTSLSLRLSRLERPISRSTRL